MSGEYGIRKGDLEIFIMHDPRRKKPCLFIKDTQDNSYVKVASFNNEFAADVFCVYADKMFAPIDMGRIRNEL